MDRKLKAITVPVAAFSMAALLLCGCQSSDYKNAVSLYNSGSYDEALAVFTELTDYKDSADYIPACTYGKAAELYKNGDFDEASALFSSLGDYEDCPALVTACSYGSAKALYDAGNYEEAKTAFEALGDYEDSAELVTACSYGIAKALYDAGNYEDAKAAFEAMGDYEDSADQVDACSYQQAICDYDAGEYETAASVFTELRDYEDSDTYLTECKLAIADALFADGDVYNAADAYADEYERSGSTDAADGVCACAEIMLDTEMEELNAGEDVDQDNVDAAKEAYKRIQDYEGATDIQNYGIFASAERLLRCGALNKALETYQQLPEDYVKNDVSAADRITWLNSKSEFLAICGEWTNTSDEDISIRIDRTSGSWDQWDCTISGDYTLTIYCVPQGDGTIEILASADYCYCSNYSDYSSNINVKSSTTGFSYTGTSVPSSIAGSSGFTLKFGSGKCTMAYSVTQTTSTGAKLTPSGTFVYDKLTKH